MASPIAFTASRRSEASLPLNFPRPHVALIAHDEMIIRNLMKILMQDEGYVVLSAADGEEALYLSRAYPGSIDLLITDVKVPRLDCTDLCSRVLEERPGIRIVVMLDTDKQGLGCPGSYSPLLPLPFDGHELKEKIRAISMAPVPPASYVYLVFSGKPFRSRGLTLLPSSGEASRPHSSMVRNRARFRKAYERYIQILESAGVR
jgi:CheY-like chemotaxis protein